MSREAKIQLSLLVAFTSLGIFQAHLPKLYELRRDGGAELDPTLRGAEYQAAGMSLLIGALVAGVARTPWPLAAAAVAAGASVAQYEWGFANAARRS